MKPILSAVIFSCMTMLSSVVIAADRPALTFHIPHSPGGSGNALSTIMAKELARRGWQVDFKALGNCALAKEHLVTSERPSIAMWENLLSVRESDRCYLPTATHDEMINIAYSAPEFLCTANAKLTADDFLAGRENYRVGIFPDVPTQEMMDKVKKHIGPGYRGITYKNVGPAHAALIAGEIDWVFSPQGIILEKEGKGRCFFNTSDQEIAGTRPLIKVKPESAINKQLILYFRGVNLDAPVMEQLRKDARAAMETPEWQTFIEGRRLRQHRESVTDQVRFVEASVKGLQ
jgi:hypothetical protein